MMKMQNPVPLLVPLIMIAALISAAVPPLTAQDHLAFPGAKGFGAYTKGGRGGKVYHVTTLEDDGPGSLRWAVEQEGPRTIVFEISGTIQLKSTLSIEHPYITIAGQTAPGDGICLRDDALTIETHDVMVRYIRCRLGDQGDSGDAISISKGKNILLDHCSASWSTDEVLSASTGEATLTNVTVQWCFITEALNPENHSYGSLIRGTGGAKYSFHHNLYAHNRGRNPRPGNYDYNPHNEDPHGLLLDFRNNVIYNWSGNYAGYNGDQESITHLNYVGNFLIPGPNSDVSGKAYRTSSPYNRAFFYGNVYDYQTPEDPWDLVLFDRAWTEEIIRSYQQGQAFEAGLMEEEDAWTAYHRVLSSGGASLPIRDSIDTRIVNDIQGRSGKIINSQTEVNGWAHLDATSPPPDRDRDGMPDAWEIINALDPNDPEDRNSDNDQDGYTNLEEYLNHLCQSTGAQF